MTETLRERQAPLKERYHADPASALKTFRIVSSTTGDDPTRVRVRTADGGETPLGEWDVAAHPMTGGPDDIPCSGDLFLASYAACQEITVRMVAPAPGRPPSSPATTLPMPWPISSLFERWRVRVMESATSEVSRLSMEPSRARVRAGWM